jgi:hypothetical protein
MLSFVSTCSGDQQGNGTGATENGVEVDVARTFATSDEVAACGALLTGTDWAALGHAYGSAFGAPEMAAALLEPDQSMRTRALDYPHGTLHHQGTL